MLLLAVYGLKVILVFTKRVDKLKSAKHPIMVSLVSIIARFGPG